MYGVSDDLYKTEEAVDLHLVAIDDISEFCVNHSLLNLVAITDGLHIASGTGCSAISEPNELQVDNLKERMITGVAALEDVLGRSSGYIHVYCNSMRKNTPTLSLVDAFY